MKSLLKCCIFDLQLFSHSLINWIKFDFCSSVHEAIVDKYSHIIAKSSTAWSDEAESPMNCCSIASLYRIQRDKEKKNEASNWKITHACGFCSPILSVELVASRWSGDKDSFFTLVWDVRKASFYFVKYHSRSHHWTSLFNRECLKINDIYYMHQYDEYYSYIRALTKLKNNSSLKVVLY